MDIKEYARNFHSKDKSGHGDHIASVESKDLVSSRVKVTESLPAQSYTPRKSSGYVYYAWDGNGRIKIGFSANPWSRVKEMRCANPSIEVLITVLAPIDPC